MKEYVIVELENDNKYAVINMLKSLDKKYFLLSRVLDDGTDIDSNFDICIYNELNNNFEPIEDEFEYESVKYIFEKKLDEQRKIEIMFDNTNIVKLKVVNIDGYNYTLEKPNGELVTKNIEIYGNIKVGINDYIHMSEETIKEENIFQYGQVINDKDEIIKIVTENGEYYLQRYYG